MNNSVNILIGGEAGQGLVTIGQILSKAFVRSGYYIVVTQSYQSRIRGGHNTYSIRVCKNEIKASQDSINILIAMDKKTALLHESDLTNDGIIVGDEAFEIQNKSIKVPFSKLGNIQFINTLFLGVISGLIAIDQKIVNDVLNEFLENKNSEILKQNNETFLSGLNWSKNLNHVFYNFPKLSLSAVNLMLNGNEGIALGALSAGVEFLSFYPMSPSTSICLTIVHYAKKMNIIYEQAEDEIAVINMAIGASYAGRTSMVATSGGGFALMTEGVSLAGMTETPLVIVVAQRPGPATGLPTRTEQGDLELVLYAGHGEFPKAIFAPGTIEQCFLLTRKAFEIAEKFQTPVFILTDQFLADSYHTVNSLETITDFSPIKKEEMNHSFKKEYKRYEITETGISPRLIPGMTENLVIADSDEHTEDGHITEDLTVRNQMVEKRLKKHKGICMEVVQPEWIGDQSAVYVFVCWGSSINPVWEACNTIRNNGNKVAALHFLQVWPLDPANFLDKLKNAKQVVSVESNARGQFGHLLRMETGFEIKHNILRYDGLPLTPEYILKKFDLIKE